MTKKVSWVAVSLKVTDRTGFNEDLLLVDLEWFVWLTGPFSCDVVAVEAVYY